MTFDDILRAFGVFMAAFIGFFAMMIITSWIIQIKDRLTGKDGKK